MTYNELNDEQKTIAAGLYLQELNEQNGEGTSYSEYANPFAYVTPEEVAEHYSGTDFVPDDFVCSSYLDEDND